MMKQLRFFKGGWSWIILLLFLSLEQGCKSRDSDLELAGKSESEIALIKRGRAVYMGACTACHNAHPARDGALGPAVAGSSLELLEARILHATYPPGYKPKRETRAMAALPQYKADLPALYAYLNAIR